MANPPSKYELNFYTNTNLNQGDWSKNWLKVVDWLTDGTYDLTVKSVTLGSANLAVTGNITASGTVTATSFHGSGSALTGIGINNKNWLYNGDCQIDENQVDYTLVKDAWGTRANNWYGMATGTAVSAGTLTTSTSGIGTTGYEVKFNQVTLTGSGVIYLRQQLSSKDSKKLIGQTVSIQARVKHDFGSALNYTIYVGKASALDDFTTVTAISNSGNLSVNSGTATVIKYEGVALGACGNGIEIKIGIVTGAITTKSFEFTELQMEISATITDFEFRPFNYDWVLCNPTLTKYKTYMGSAFNGETANDNSTKSCVVGDLQTTNIGTAYYEVPVDLDDNATITQLTMWYSRVKGTITLDLIRTGLSVGGSGDIISRATGDSSSGTRTSVDGTTPVNTLVDNSNYSYVLRVNLQNTDAASNTTLGAAYIKCTVTAPVSKYY